MSFPQHSPSGEAREIELRRETVAVMRLRGSFDRCDRLTHRSPQSDVLPSPHVPPNGGAIPPIGILSICDYDGLRMARELLLNHQGYSTQSFESRDSSHALSGRDFHLAILCHSVAQEQAIRIAEMLHRQNPSIKVLRLSSSELRGCSSFDYEVDSCTDIGMLLEIIRGLVLGAPRPPLRS